MNRNITSIILIAAIYILLPTQAYSQVTDEFMSDRYIRVAEAGELVDSVNVLGDVSNAGRYLVPEGTNLPELIAFSFGYSQQQSRNSNVDWGRTMIEVKVSRYIKNEKLVEVAYFRYKYYDPEPVEMFEFDLQNNDIVTLQVRRNPSLTDYVSVVAPVVSVIATSILLIQNLRGN